jgi:hypothetical protein
MFEMTFFWSLLRFASLLFPPPWNRLLCRTHTRVLCRYVTTINTIGNALVIDSKAEMSLIAPKSGFGGLGGSLVKQVFRIFAQPGEPRHLHDSTVTPPSNHHYGIREPP